MLVRAGLRQGLVALLCIAAGCSDGNIGRNHEPTSADRAPSGGKAAAAIAAPPALPDTIVPAAAPPAAAAIPEPPVEPRSAAPLDASNAPGAEPGVESPAPLAAAPAEPRPVSAEIEQEGTASAIAATPLELEAAIVADALDFDGLVKRLRKTKAINLSTKLAFKSQSDDLLDGFRAYHRQRGTATLADLRRSYDSLFRKLHSMLRDADPPLDRDIDRSRSAIWEILADPTKFRQSNLMAGA